MSKPEIGNFAEFLEQARAQLNAGDSLWWAGYMAAMDNFAALAHPDAKQDVATLRVLLNGANERAKLLLDSMNHWADRARSAEAALARSAALKGKRVGEMTWDEFWAEVERIRPKTETDKCCDDLFALGCAFMRSGKRIDPAAVRIEWPDESAPEPAERPALSTNPHTGTSRDQRDVESDPEGLLIAKSGGPMRAATDGITAVDDAMIERARGAYAMSMPGTHVIRGPEEARYVAAWRNALKAALVGLGGTKV
jgi:hypothetical protein